MKSSKKVQTAATRQSSTQTSNSTKQSEPGAITDSPGSGYASIHWKSWILPLSGIAMLLLLSLGYETDAVKHPWDLADHYCDSSRSIQDPNLKLQMLEEGGRMFRESVKKHPYHARIWSIFGHYYAEKKDWDSSIFVSRKAIELGHGAPINSIVEPSNQLLIFAINQKLMPFYNDYDTAMKIISLGEVPGYENLALYKLKGFVHMNCGNKDTAISMLSKTLVQYPNDNQVLSALANLHQQKGNLAEFDRYNRLAAASQSSSLKPRP